MPDTLLLETGTDHFLLEDDSGFLLMEVPVCYYDVIRAANPVGYWRLGEATGTVAADSSDNGLSGVYTSTTGNVTLGVTGFLTGDTNTAVTLTRASVQYIELASRVASFPTANAARSMEIWVKIAAGGPLANDDMIGWGGAAAPSFFLMRTDANANLLLTNGTTSYQLSSRGEFSAGTTRHVVITYDGAGIAVGYIDGVATGSAAVGTLTTGATQAALGAFSNFFDGTLDEAAIYNVALTPLQVQTHYNSASAGCQRHFGPIVLQAMNRAATR